MPKLIWFNQPSNHSGTSYFLYLTPDGDVEDLSIEMSNGGGIYILGGPVLMFSDLELMESAFTLLSLLPAGFHFFPPENDSYIRQAVKENKNNDSYHWIESYSKMYNEAQCRELLLSDTMPESAIVFVDQEENGSALFGAELARLYFNLPKKQRQKLGLKHDWNAHFNC